MPRLLEVLTFCSHRDADELLAGIEVLRELNRTGRRKVPRDAPLTFVPKAWMPLVGSGPDKVSRRFWELALLWRLRDALRAGDVWVAGSRRYADPETYLLDETSWAAMRGDYCAAVGRPDSGRERIAQLGRELDEELASFADMLARGEGPVRLDGDHLVVGRDTGDDLPPSVKRTKALIGEVFPQVELSEVVIAIDSICGFSRHLLHAAGTKSRSPAMLIHLYAAILAQATNLGPVAMARASGLSYDQVAHATAWYLREETLTPAIDEVINYHHRLPAARAWGDGTFASSDGQRFPVQVKAANAGALPRYFGFGRGLSVLTSVTDHYATFGTKVIPTLFSSHPVGCLHVCHEQPPPPWGDVLYGLSVMELMSSTEPASGSFWALKTVSLVDGSVGWTVVDDEYEVQPQTAAFLYALRFAADRAEGTCRTYSRHLSLYFTWLAESRRDWRQIGAVDLASFVLWLQRTPTRTGRYGGPRARSEIIRLSVDEPVRSASTVNGITTAVREFYGWLAAHDQVDTGVARRLSAARVRKKDPQRRPKVLADDQVRRLLGVCTNARDRFLVQLLWRCGLRLSEALGLRREDLHFLPSSEHVGCQVPGAHVHVIRREGNENGAWAKSRWPRYVPAPRELVDAYAAYRWEGIVNLFGLTSGGDHSVRG